MSSPVTQARRRNLNRANRTICPVCGGTCSTVKTDQITPQYREATLACENVECAAVFVASITPVRFLQPSRKAQTDETNSSPQA
ncbi:MAG: ogr/Delta-like zinc finger family protein [Alphaproteobacteria bacterium]|nr:ogr/Delta-like zinc finger family protein [Alphaproteobacteria bacterium]